MSMYNNKLVASIKVNNQVLREFGETVKLPFGSEYSIFLKNLNTLRAIVDITIDGQDVTEGGLVINANSSLDLERFLKQSNLEKGNRFKFIERNEAVENHRGIQAEDGLIRIEYEFEKPAAQVVYRNIVYQDNIRNWPFYNKPYIGDMVYGDIGYASLIGSSVMSKGMSAASINNAVAQNSVSLSSNKSNGLEQEMKCSGSIMRSFNDAGITVAGSESNQKFKEVASFATDGIKHVIVLKLLGENPEGKVKIPVTVKTKQKCTTCGTVNKANAKFCSACGTALEIL